MGYIETQKHIPDDAVSNSECISFSISASHHLLWEGLLHTGGGVIMTSCKIDADTLKNNQLHVTLHVWFFCPPLSLLEKLLTLPLNYTIKNRIETRQDAA